MRRRSVRHVVVLATTAVLTLATVPGIAAGSPAVAQQLAQVRAATAQYHDVSQALADGYAQASGCVPGMGFHYVRSIAAGQSDLNTTVPNVLVYAPRPDGSLRLVAVEYASWSPASLFDTAFASPGGGGPPFHTLHAWVWQANPDGIFAPFNPNILCPG